MDLVTALEIALTVTTATTAISETLGTSDKFKSGSIVTLVSTIIKNIIVALKSGKSWK